MGRISKARLLSDFNASPENDRPKCRKCGQNARLPDNQDCFDCKGRRKPREYLVQEFGDAPSNAKPRCRRCKRNTRLPNRLTCSDCKKKDRDYQDQYILQVVEHYGGSCYCCGESMREFLEVDHVENNGAAHRTLIGNRKGANLSRYLVKKGFPKDIKLQLLCANCNKAKEYHGVCPHEQLRNSSAPTRRV
jgi:hypothetical protein